jgi:hypothetical protein
MESVPARRSCPAALANKTLKLFAPWFMAILEIKLNRGSSERVGPTSVCVFLQSVDTLELD